MAAIMGGLTTVVDLVNNVFTMISENPLLVVYVAAGLVTVGIGVFGAIKGAARS